MCTHHWEYAIIVLDAVEDMQKEKPWQRKLLIRMIDITQHVKEVTSYWKIETLQISDLTRSVVYFSINFLNCRAYRQIKKIHRLILLSILTQQKWTSIKSAFCAVTEPKSLHSLKFFTQCFYFFTVMFWALGSQKLVEICQVLPFHNVIKSRLCLPILICLGFNRFLLGPRHTPSTKLSEKRLCRLCVNLLMHRCKNGTYLLMVM